ncbi:hypothetical protein GCM10029976_031830 [Kribbella albertanoniae]
MTTAQVRVLVSQNCGELAGLEGTQSRAADHYAATPPWEAVDGGSRMIDHQYAEVVITVRK